LYPILVVSTLTRWGWQQPGGPAMTALIALRLCRGGFARPQGAYLPLLAACLLAECDLRSRNVQQLFPTIFTVLVIVWPKCEELLLKLHFVLAYVAPWQIR
jgi:hypothetical protein